ncbi:MAG: hypothetical protein IJL72_11210 [Lachnospiraceae bacterium]|nr:hypothetical protein [Lachnospiraceae bacterium]
MSRAFVKEDDGLSFCFRKKQECMYADKNGECYFDECRKAEEAPRKKVTGLRIERPKTPDLSVLPYAQNGRSALPSAKNEKKPKKR